MNKLAAPSSAASPPEPRAKPEIAVWRLYLLRLGYLIMAVGLGSFIAPNLFHYTEQVVANDGVRTALLSGFAALAVLGLRYPLKMLPLLLLEFTWKIIYLLCYYVPLSNSGRLTPDIWADGGACMMGAIFIPLVPWDYVVRHFILERGEHW